MRGVKYTCTVYIILHADSDKATVFQSDTDHIHTSELNTGKGIPINVRILVI